MNKTLKGIFLVVLIATATIALSGGNLASAKDYSVTVGDWQVDFRSNSTLYTDVVWNEPKDSTSNGYYTINVKEDQGITTRASMISVLNFQAPIPVGNDTMEYFAKKRP